MGNQGLKLNKYSVGTGDRFAHQAKAQLQACVKALEHGVEVVPVWNKSNREHNIIGSEPASVRQAADAAVKALGWKLPYYCDADHITPQTVDRFLAPCDFFTFDVADFIGQPAQAGGHREIRQAASRAARQHRAGRQPTSPLRSRRETLKQTAQKFLAAVKKAGEVYRRVLERQGRGQLHPRSFDG